MYLETKIDKNPQDRVSDWWNDGDSKLKKLVYIVRSWWNDGANKLIKAIYVSLFLHLVFGFFWLLQHVFT